MDDLLKNANSGETILYIIIGICIGIVLISSVIISVILIFVIKDKSHVTAIFAEIRKEEVEKVIFYAKSIPIASTRFKTRHLTRSQGDEEKYWKIVAKSQKQSADFFKKDAKLIEAAVRKVKKEDRSASTAAPISNYQEEKNEDNTVSPKEEKKTENPGCVEKQENEFLNDEIKKIEALEEEKHKIRKSLLSQIEYFYIISF